MAVARATLDALYAGESAEELEAALTAWTNLVLDNERAAAENLAVAGFGRDSVVALQAGLDLLRRKQRGRLMDMNPHQSFAALGIVGDPNADVHFRVRKP